MLIEQCVTAALIMNITLRLGLKGTDLFQWGAIAFALNIKMLTNLPTDRRGKMKGMQIERIWAMPSAWTFTIKPIKELLTEEVHGYSCDPFAGKNSPASVTNDLNPERPTTFHMDALEFLKSQPDEHYDTVLFDPPYSITQAKEHYAGLGMDKLDVKPTSMQYWGDCKTEVARITKKGGKVICFGWNSMGIGKNRGFEMKRILLVPHGGSKNDTIVTVETKS